ncbi:P-loop containing nucleoside triphosphate hydrolase protein [Panus rudis PR-1116 ss-1]|nr:P-loop containing nucleoside triphosphate hydrolase protein [Panus rudis PR-1116 ss-1]
MSSPSVADLARELGYDPTEYEDGYEGDSGIGLSQPTHARYNATHALGNGEDYYDTNDIEYSSPCPQRYPSNTHVFSSQRRQPVFQDQNPSGPLCEEENHYDDDDSNTQHTEDHNISYQYTQQTQPRVHANSQVTVRSNSDWNRSTVSGYQDLPSYSNRQNTRIQSSRPNPPQQSRASSYRPQTGPPEAWVQRHQDESAAPQDNSERGFNPRNSHGIRLKPVSDLPDMYRGMFKFGVFNAVQSQCYDEVMRGDDNMVISAPTGSGKTVLFELAIIRMLVNARGGTPKCIYVAPTKALCSEKFRDWTTKFQPLGVKCCELTGDTVHFGKSAWGDARDASVMREVGQSDQELLNKFIRSEHGKILSQIQLFLVDEIHILNESRGSTLEVIVSRMKARGSSVRFIFVSATVPNIDDVAAWVGRGPVGGSAVVKELQSVHQFGEEFRPCKLSRFVYGIPRRQDQNDFQFTKALDYRLYGILQQHSVNKPMLVFCATRKGVMSTAEHLLKEYEGATEQKKTLPWTRPRRIDRTFHDKRLDKLAACGIGVHHAGMTMDDRRATEDLYLNKTLRIIVATSTLAVGVNLPAHTVIIKGVKIFQNNVSQEYSDLDIVQMMGRAGRPQFGNISSRRFTIGADSNLLDKEGVAIILCEKELEAKYNALAQGQTVLESCLHKNLSEHINSEIGLGTITDIQSAKEWLHNSFLFQRIQKNPRNYAIGKEGNQTWQDKIDEMVTESIKTLQTNELVAEEGKRGALRSTPFGDIMSKYYIRQSTMGMILALPEKPSLRELLEALSTSEEFSEIKFRSGEKQIYNKLRVHDDIRFKLKKIEKGSDKIFLNIQAVLGGINLNDPEYKNGDNQPQLESLTIFRHIARIARAMVEVGIEKANGAQVKHGMELLRCLSAKSWEDRPTVLRQIEHLGERSIKVLAQHSITTFAALRKQDTLRLEMLLNRRPPFGNELLAIVRQLPEYTLEIEEVDVAMSDGKSPVTVELSVTCGLRDEEATGAKPKKNKGKGQDYTDILTVDSDLNFIDFRRISTRGLKSPRTFSIIAALTKPSQSVLVQITSESIAGVSVTETYKPRIPHSRYPTMDTRPMTAIERDLEGLEDVPDFWDMNIDDEGNEKPTVVRDLTVPRATTSQSYLAASNGPSADVLVPQTSTRRRKTILKQKQRKKAQDQQNPSIVACQTNNLRLPRESSQMGTMSPSSMLRTVVILTQCRCNHSCKDKTACRHFCCRDGLAKPPPKPRKTNSIESQSHPQSKISSQKAATQDPKDSVTHSVKAKTSTKQPPKKSASKPDRRLEELEQWHNKTNVRERLHLPEGRRLKLEDDKSLSSSSPVRPPNRFGGSATKHGKERRVPNFDIEFADLSVDKDEMPFNERLEKPEDSDSEDLPERLTDSALLASKASAAVTVKDAATTKTGKQDKARLSSDTDSADYDDPGFYDLLQAADLIPGSTSAPRKQTKSTPAPRIDSKHDRSSSPIIDLTSPSPSTTTRKRAQPPELESSASPEPQKRVKWAPELSSTRRSNFDSHTITGSLPRSPRQKYQKPLFLPDSPGPRKNEDNDKDEKMASDQEEDDNAPALAEGEEFLSYKKVPISNSRFQFKDFRTLVVLWLDGPSNQPLQAEVVKLL